MKSFISTKRAPVLLGTALLVLVGAVAGTAKVSAEKGSGGSGGGGSTANIGDAKQFNLTGLRSPDPANLGDFVKNKSWAIVLGKALFWDQQAGSDGIQACASCHFTAGVDTRTAGNLHTASALSTLTDLTDFPNMSGDTGGSQGVHPGNATFTRVYTASESGSVLDECSPGVLSGHRMVTGMNTPTNINTTFNFRNFWDGRAGNVFNGDIRNAANLVYRSTPTGLQAVAVSIKGSSAATQATGPPLSEVEMSCAGRKFADLGHKLLSRTALLHQKVSVSDSVLASSRHSSGNGLQYTYAQLVKKAFQDDLTGSAMAEGYPQIEKNFSLFWGLAIQAYEATLVSDMRPIDRFANGDTSALNAQEQQGLSLFVGKGRCANCHKGPQMTDAVNGSGGQAFVNTGVRPTSEGSGDIIKGQGRFKTPGLSNVELTGPYFHNGSRSTLAQVVDFYNRGGDFPSQDVDSQIRPLGLTGAEQQALVSFLMKLTDERVRHRSAPFDGPELDLSDANGPHIQATGAAGTNGADMAKAFVPQN